MCAANGNQTCRPSSCGDIQNISNPFRLKGDPSWCGDSEYELLCENNRTMVNLDPGKFYVADINYDHYTIRIVDPGLKKGNCFSTPLYSLSYYRFESYDILGVTNTTVLMNCEQPISDDNYIPITPCNSSNVTSSSSQAHVYALVGGKYMLVNDIKYSCTILSTITTQFLKSGNLSMSDLLEVLLLGLDFSFLRFRCKNECDVKGLSCDADITKNTVKCTRYSFGFWFSEYLESLRGFREYDSEYYYESALYAGWLMRYIAMIIIGGTYLVKEVLALCTKENSEVDALVAIKMLVMSKANGQDFINEVATIGRIHHVNVMTVLYPSLLLEEPWATLLPELFYKSLGGVSFKADVYSFGMLLLEMVGKRKNVNAFAEHSSQIYFPSWIYNRYDQGEDMEMGDATEDEKKYVRKMVIVAAMVYTNEACGSSFNEQNIGDA
ncbi:Rust resistance kinase Lr10 [Vitis vinifera]|uniref:Rust resistance kinase Lr10 n=1 Tax=Vitis vinifera TaxID=29760 RepID=A0A438HSW0_VITVI|nr:Rust resistance kinase Lr10 [Vitis vinifera]